MPVTRHFRTFASSEATRASRSSLCALLFAPVLVSSTVFFGRPVGAVATIFRPTLVDVIPLNVSVLWAGDGGVSSPGPVPVSRVAFTPHRPHVPRWPLGGVSGSYLRPAFSFLFVVVVAISRVGLSFTFSDCFSDNFLYISRLPGCAFFLLVLVSRPSFAPEVVLVFVGRF
jgi:hypothetical protein